MDLDMVPACARRLWGAPVPQKLVEEAPNFTASTSRIPATLKAQPIVALEFLLWTIGEDIVDDRPRLGRLSSPTAHH